MSENEKLRALLAEARGVIDEGYDRGIPSIIQRIDAALAESVDKTPLTYLNCGFCGVSIRIISPFNTRTYAALVRAFDRHHDGCVPAVKEKKESK